MPRLSIIIPCFNCESHILNLLRMIDSQLNEHVEVILINDGSKDNTETVIDRFIKENNKPALYHLFTFENQGAALSRTKGLELARGEFIFYIDSDDIIADNSIEEIFRQIENKPDVIYFSSIMNFTLEKRKSYKIHFAKYSVYYNPNDFLIRQLRKGYWTAAVWSFIFRRQLAIDSNAHFTKRVAHEDHIFALSIILSADKIICVPDLLYTQLRSEGSLTTSAKSDDYVTERYSAYKEVISELKEKFSKKSLRLYIYWSMDSCLGLWREVYSIRKAVSKKHFRTFLWNEQYNLASYFFYKLTKLII